VEDVARLQPDLVILDLYPLADNPYWILDELRANPATQAVPVLAASTMETLAEKALASYNVRVTLEKPFGLEDFLAKVREALNQPPLHADVPKRVETAPLDLVEQAAGVVARYSRGTLFRWVQRLRQEPPWKDRQDLDLGKVLNDVPVLVEALSIALQYRSADEMLSHQPEIAERVRRHAELRKRQGFSLSGLIREYDLLRDELLAMLELHLPTEIHAADLFTVVRLVNGTLDRIMEITIPAYASAPEASTGNLPRAA
jgi:CheY-like chemotaxis protein